MATKDEQFMERALELAEKAKGKTSPNPLVGAVLIKTNKIIGEGYHKQSGKPHAEIEAINDAKRNGNAKKIKGSTLFVTLEPCCHQGKTPPCTDAIINEGISNVVIATKDPNPINSKGTQYLKKAKIKVSFTSKEVQQRAEKNNEAYNKFITTGIPFVINKAALSLDGKIASTTGESKWISSEQSRKYAHQLRSECDAVLIGINTVLTDDPELTPRLTGKKGKDPLRVILDSDLKIPLSAKVLKDNNAIIFTTDEASFEKKKILADRGIEVIARNSKKEKISLRKVIEYLAQREIMSILIEGGSEINASALQEEIVDKIIYFIAPKLIGGRDALSVIGGVGISKIEGATIVKQMTFRTLGEDIVVEGYL